MRILHYFLGFPPYRTGGLTKYAFDLMQAQAKEGDDVFALWPGEMKKTGADPIIREQRKVAGIISFELMNPLPVPLDEGIVDIAAFTKPCSSEVYIAFLRKLKLDVIHIHTLMGLHREFVDAARMLRIRTVFTSHDYFGLCPKVTLYRYGQCCDDDHGCVDCIQCNVNALSLSKIQMMQSPLYRQMKNTPIVKLLRKKHRGRFFEEEGIPTMPDIDVKAKADQYKQLRAYYTEMYESMDIIHFNSSQTKRIYEKYMTPRSSRVISITHKEIGNHQQTKHVDGDKLRILCLAPAKPFKGYQILKSALDEMWNSGNHDFVLCMYSAVPKAEPYMIVKEDGYHYAELPEIFSNADVLVAPSIWYETFGFTVLEALSYGVPVIVSDHVGAKDVIGDGGIVIQAGSAEALKEAMINVKLDVLRKNIQQNVKMKLWADFVKENASLYERTTS